MRATMVSLSIMKRGGDGTLHWEVQLVFVVKTVKVM
jgi:hypothetical protein